MARRKSKYSSGNFTPKNPEKYLGNVKAITYRSSWEFIFMTKCDEHPNIVKWGSEVIRIPYFNPITNESTSYVPDFLVFYIDKHGKLHSELIEIKPLKETMMEAAKTKRDMIMVAVNQAKWMAAENYCKSNGMRFRIMTEESIFGKK